MSSSEENTMNDRITIEGRDGAFGAYISRPKSLPAPAVVVLHEVFGVNADIHKACDELAQQGLPGPRIAPPPASKEQAATAHSKRQVYEWSQVCE